MNKEFYIMLITPPVWGGPSVEVVSEPEARTNRGTIVSEIEGLFKFKLIVDSRVDDPNDYPALDAHESARTVLFSSKMISVLKKLSIDNVQYFDADVSYEPTGESLDYKVANIIGVISALDLQNSDVVLSRKGKVLEIEKMVLDETKMQGQKIFRLRESILHIVVHKSVKEALEQEGVTGLKFVTDDEFEPGML